MTNFERVLKSTSSSINTWLFEARPEPPFLDSELVSDGSSFRYTMCNKTGGVVSLFCDHCTLRKMVIHSSQSDFLKERVGRRTETAGPSLLLTHINGTTRSGASNSTAPCVPMLRGNTVIVQAPDSITSQGDLRRDQPSRRTQGVLSGNNEWC